MSVSVTRKELAEMLNVSGVTIDFWRKEGMPSAFIVEGCKHVFEEDVCRLWVKNYREQRGLRKLKFLRKSVLVDKLGLTAGIIDRFVSKGMPVQLMNTLKSGKEIEIFDVDYCMDWLAEWAVNQKKELLTVD